MNAQIDTLIYKETTPLLAGNPHLNNVYCIDRKLKGFKRLSAELRLLLKLRREKYDVVVHLTDQWIGALIARTSAAPLRIETFYTKRNQAFWHASFTHIVQPPKRGQLHAVELNLLCTQYLGIDANIDKAQVVLVPNAQLLVQAEENLRAAGVNGPFVLIHPAARWPFKCWEDERFAAVVAHVRAAGLHVVLTSSPDPAEVMMTTKIEHLAQDLNEALNFPSCAALVNWGGQVSLPLLTALLKKCQFYVGVDSAPMHMAAALDTPQVALFGPSWINEWRPWSSAAIVVYAGDFGALPHPDSINTDENTRLLKLIPTQAVLDPIDKLIAKLSAQ